MLPNLLSLLRIPLAFLFLIDDSWYRSTALVGAMLTDVLDGFLARRYQQSSQLGAWLDPLADKFFMLFALIVFFLENRMTSYQIAAMLSRDIALLLFGGYLFLVGQMRSYRVQAILFGKMMTALQLIVACAIVWRMNIPSLVFLAFIFLGALSLGELFFNNRTGATTKGQRT